MWLAQLPAMDLYSALLFQVTGQQLPVATTRRTLARIEALFGGHLPAPADRGRAIGAWSGLSGVAIAAGPLIGGYLISAASWRWIFFINAPIAAAVVAPGARHVPESRDPSATGKIDYAGALAAVVSLTGVTFAFIEAPALGWASPAVLAMTLAGVAGWPRSWPGSIARPRRCCRVRSSPTGSSRRPPP